MQDNKKIVGHFWKVSTIYDAESTRIKDLGIYFGNIDEIAFALANESYPSVPLYFKLVDPYTLKDAKPQKNNVAINISKEDFELVEKYLEEKDILINISQDFYSKKTIVLNMTLGKEKILQTQYSNKIAIQKALDKLSPEEKVLLGL